MFGNDGQESLTLQVAGIVCIVLRVSSTDISLPPFQTYSASNFFLTQGANSSNIISVQIYYILEMSKANSFRLIFLHRRSKQPQNFIQSVQRVVFLFTQQVLKGHAVDSKMVPMSRTFSLLTKQMSRAPTFLMLLSQESSLS